MGNEAQCLNDTVGVDYEVQRYFTEKGRTRSRKLTPKPPQVSPSKPKQWSYSRVDCFKQCPYKFRLRYIDRLGVIPSDEADNALVLGTALHIGIEKGLEAAIDECFNAFHIITDRPYWKPSSGSGWKYISDHITEQIKLEYFIPKVQVMLPQGGIHELKIETEDFIGYVDYLAPTGEPNEYDLYDFKYTKDGKRYKHSAQLHLYKYFLEQRGLRIRSLNYLIIPKLKMIKINKTEEVFEYRLRVFAELEKVNPPFFMEIQFDYRKVIDFLFNIKRAQEATEYPKSETRLCDWCEYQLYCQKGLDYMILPKNEPVKQGRRKKTIWLYGEPYTGKTTFASQFPDHLFITTDSNIRELMTYATGEMPPAIEIKDIVTKEGRITNRKLAWIVFIEAVAALEVEKTDFKTLVVDHLSELYKHCRFFIYDREKITHESDNSFKYYDIVKTEFLSALKRLINLNYENIIFISHEDRTKDITKKGGDKITAIKPALQDSILSSIAGMVDITARTLAEDGKHLLSFKTSEVIFGGGRLKPQINEIALDYNEFLKLYDENAKATPAPATGRQPRKPKTKKPPKDEAPPAEELADVPQPIDTEENPEPHFIDAEETSEPEPQAEELPADKPVRTRRKRGE